MFTNISKFLPLLRKCLAIIVCCIVYCMNTDPDLKKVNYFSFRLWPIRFFSMFQVDRYYPQSQSIKPHSFWAIRSNYTDRHNFEKLVGLTSNLIGNLIFSGENVDRRAGPGLLSDPHFHSSLFQMSHSVTCIIAIVFHDVACHTIIQMTSLHFDRFSKPSSPSRHTTSQKGEPSMDDEM